jgi:uncharacterized protein YydD (DUF2326 family)
MATIDELKDEIRELQKKYESYKEQLRELQNQRNDEVSVEKKQGLADDIKFVRKMILEKDKQITSKERQITADKEKEAADSRQIAADKEYRLQRGEQPLHR